MSEKTFQINYTVLNTKWGKKISDKMKLFEVFFHTVELGTLKSANTNFYVIKEEFVSIVPLQVFQFYFDQ